MTDDPRDIWQNQTTEGVTMSLPEIHERASRLKTRMRRSVYTMWVIWIVHVLGDNVARALLPSGRFDVWIGVFEFVTLMLVLLYWPYQQVRLREWPLSVVPGTSPLPGVDFYRRQLIAQKDIVSDEYWGPGPRGAGMLVMIAIALVLYSVRYPAAVILLAVPIAILTIVIYRHKRRELPQIQRELDELKAFMKESGA